MLKKTLGAGLLFTGIMALTAMNVCAYIDPSVLSYIMQAALALIIGSGAIVGIYWKKIKLFFKRKKENKAGGPAIAKAQVAPNNAVNLANSMATEGDAGVKSEQK